MCQGLTRLGHRVELHAPANRSIETDQEIFSYYGISDVFSLRKHFAPAYPSVPGRIIYALGCAQGLRQTAPQLVYGRDWPALLMAANLGFSVVLELHAPAPERGSKLSLFKQLVRSTKLVRLVVNSENLYANVAGCFPEVRERLVMARNGADPVPPDDDRPPPIARTGRAHDGGLYRAPLSGEGHGNLGRFCPSMRLGGLSRRWRLAGRRCAMERAA